MWFIYGNIALNNGISNEVKSISFLGGTEDNHDEPQTGELVLIELDTF
jgi:hypothetical protein